jgi:hypothetical protein
VIIIKIKFIVGEPWDFVGPDGEGNVLGLLVGKGIGKYGDWIICNCNPFFIDGLNISSLLVSARSKGSLFSRLELGNSVSANAYWRKDGMGWDEHSVNQAESDSTIIGGWLVGGIQIISN